MGGSVRIPAAWSGVVGFEAVVRADPDGRAAGPVRLDLAPARSPAAPTTPACSSRRKAPTTPTSCRSAARPRSPADPATCRSAVRAVDRPRLLHGRSRDRRRRGGRGRAPHRRRLPSSSLLRSRSGPRAGLDDVVGGLHGDLLRRRPRANRRAHGLRRRCADRPRAHRLGRGVQAGRAGAHRLWRAGRRARRPRRLLCPTMAVAPWPASKAAATSYREAPPERRAPRRR